MRLALLSYAVLLATSVSAQTLRPRFNLVAPSGGQRGTTLDITLTGTNLGYAGPRAGTGCWCAGR